MLTIVLLLLSICLTFLSLMIGPSDISVLASFSALFGGGLEVDRVIMWELRMPRTLLAFLIGATLAMSGAAMQGLMRNPLASPSLLGSTNFAALGAVIAIFFFSANKQPIFVTLAAIFMSLFSAFLLFRISGRDSRVITLLLAGLALSSLASALVALALNLSPNAFAIAEIAFWLLGSLSNRTNTDVLLACPFMLISWVILIIYRRALLAMTLGEEVAQTLGVSVRAAKIWMAVAVALGVGAAVSVSGVIGFIGLVVPHIIRPFVRYDPARLLIPSALAGACLLLTADCLVRLIPSSTELKLGVITALIAVPFFLYLVLRERQGRPAFV
ncbi:MAG: FecCD family ABC transporter permease [Methyloligellaceae bacterium]